MPSNDILLIISVIMSALSVILVAGVLKKSNNNTTDSLEQKIDYINKNMGDEFHRIRVENQNANKEIREDVKYNSDGKLIKLLPILFALPEKEDERVADFLNKRTHILSILKVMYPDKCQGIESVTLGLKAETWEDTDRWFMTLVASELANRKHVDVIAEDDSEDIIKTKYCTSDWLSRTLTFMFQRS